MGDLLGFEGGGEERPPIGTAVPKVAGRAAVRPRFALLENARDLAGGVEY
jgi:hypothetical protein